MRYMKFRDRLALASEYTHWSKRKIASQAGIPEQALYSAIRDDAAMNVSYAIKIAKVLRVPVEWLFSEDEKEPSPTTRPWWWSDETEKEYAAALGQRVRAALSQARQTQERTENQ